MQGIHHNVCDLDAPAVCSGCGACAGMCPEDVLEIQFNANGEYAPVVVNEHCTDCGICLGICPFTFSAGKKDESQLADLQFGSDKNLQYDPIAGYYGQCYAGYSNVDRHRTNGSSGGLVTWLIETLLERGLVDAVAAVVPNDGDQEKLFKFALIDQIEEIRQASKSCYYPVELSGVIHKILQDDRRYAVVGIPCFIKALQLARSMNPILDQRVVYTVGLVCGSLPSKRFADYLCASREMDPEQLIRIRFRVKSKDRPANDHGISLQTRTAFTTVYWSEGIKHLWDIGYFKPESCQYCDDVFAETADVVFMDAWLPQYVRDQGGTSLVVTRDPAISEVIREGEQRQDIFLESVSIEQVLKSQAGGIKVKKKILAHRLFVQGRRRGLNIQKRVQPEKFSQWDQVLLFNLRERMRKIGRSIFLTDPTPRGVQAMKRKIQFLLKEYNWVNKIGRRLHQAKLKFAQVMNRR